jgi:hypothetical protein
MKKTKPKPSHFKGRQLFKSNYTEMKKLNVLFRKRPSTSLILLVIAWAMSLMLIPVLFASCEEEDPECGSYVEYKTGRNVVYKSDLTLGEVAGGGLTAFSYDEAENVGKFTFTYVNDTKRCSKNPDGYDFRSVVDAWIYIPSWPDPDLVYSAEIEMLGLGRKVLTPVATGAGPNTIHLTATNGWMDFGEKDEAERVMTRISIGFVDFDDKEIFINYLIDSLKLELQYSEFYYRI